MSRHPDAIEIDAFSACLSARQRTTFQNAYQSQIQARRDVTKRDESGGTSYTSSEAIKKYLGECLKYTEWR
jgi:hypothetical protein